MKTENNDKNNKTAVNPDKQKYDWEKARERRHTYVFKQYNEEVKLFFPTYDKKTLEQYPSGRSKEILKVFERELYKSPEKPPYDNYIHHSNWQLDLLIEFFGDVFHDKSAQLGIGPSHTYFKVILPDKTYKEIMEVINENGLLQIRDLIFEIISIAQKKYTEDIAFWEQDSSRKLINTARKESLKAIDVIEKANPINLIDGGSSRLTGINFLFNDSVIKINHEWLAGEFVEHFKEHYSNLLYKDWRKDLERYPLRYEENKDKLNFRFILALSFYNLLTETGIFKIEKKGAVPNNLMHCIAKLMEFSLINIFKDGDSQSEKAKKVRNWIKRSTLKRIPAYQNVKADLPKLRKYFSEDFLGLGEDVKRADAVSAAIYFGKRFGLEAAGADLAHLYQCLEQVNFYIGYQISGERKRSGSNFAEFEAFKTLLEGVNAGRNIQSISFKIEGNDAELPIVSALPLQIIQEALKKYQDNNRVEVDTELYKVHFKKTDNGSIQIRSEKTFSAPEDRFIVSFVGGFYNYLKNETSLPEDEFYPKRRYYNIIGKFLSFSRFFYADEVAEDYAEQKVGNWHSLFLKRENNKL
jgi:hypothetical protein